MLLTLLFASVLTLHACALSGGRGRAKLWLLLIGLAAALVSFQIDFTALSDTRIDGLAFGGMCG